MAGYLSSRMAVELNEKLLNNAGGWQAMKHARALFEAGRVKTASYEPPLLTGLVREGEVEYRAGLRIRSATDVENLCRCRESRQWGKICAHSLAVGLAITRPQPKPAAPAIELPPVAADGIQFSTSQGEPISLRFILPPSIEKAWERGGITVAVETFAGGRRCMLEALPKGREWQVSQQDLDLINHIRSLNAGRVAGMLIFPKEQFLDLLGLLRGHGGVTCGRDRRIEVSAERHPPHLALVPQPDGGLSLNIEWPDSSAKFIAAGNAWIEQGTRLVPLVLGLPAQYRSLLEGPVQLPALEAAKFQGNELPALQTHFQTDAAPPEIEEGIPVLLLELEGSLNHLAAKLKARYADKTVVAGASSGDLFTFRDPADSQRVKRRNLAVELRAIDRLRNAGFSGPDSSGTMTLRSERNILPFFAALLPQLQREWEVRFGTRFRNVTAGIERITPEVRIESSGENWFEFDLTLRSESGERLSAADIQRLLRSGQSHQRQKNGRLAVFDPGMLDDLQQLLKDCDPRQVTPGRFRMDRAHAGYLSNTLEEIPGARLDESGGQLWSRRSPGPVDLGDLETILRPYQKNGIEWMRLLASRGFGAILADEMGLGKTLQSLAFLQAARREGLAGPALVVAPSSLVYNWTREARRFTPEMEVLPVEGADRAAALERLGSADLIVTSYALLRRDAERYRRHRFSTVILDEAQHIKNPDTLNAQAASDLRADFRIALTGTPIENSVRDIWSLTQFVLPGYLGERDAFRETYEIPVSKDPSGPEIRRLKRRLKPILLRRRKQDVITDIPDKLEQVTYCELTTTQRQIYEDLLRQGRLELDRALDQGGVGPARMMALNLLLRLRQVCCAPSIIGLPAAESESGKLEALEELLDEAVDGGHKVLIFSQFVSVLRILRTRLDRREIAFSYLDGAVKNRAGEVDRFQESADVPVFLISLKAGGTGLNLTAADTVVHFDPWWNPAVENQATDRAHRIGQRKVVTSYKLITRGTVEEKILELQRRKRSVIAAALESEEPLMTGLNLEEIEALLA